MGGETGSLFVEAGGGGGPRADDTAAVWRSPLLLSAGSPLSSAGAGGATGARLSLLCCRCPASQVIARVTSARRKCGDRHGWGWLLGIERFLTKINLCRLLDN